MEALLSIITGGFGGALLRLIPEGIKMFNGWQDRKHELAILDKQLAQQAAGHQQRLEEIRVTSEAQTTLAQINGAVVLTKATGNKWVDLANGLFRPTVSFWLFGIYAMFKTMALVLWVKGMWGEAALLTQETWAASFPWFEDDAAMLAGIMSFWFLGRAMEKK